MLSHCVLFLSLVLAVLSEPTRFDRYRVYRLTPHNTAQMDHLRRLNENPEGLDFWTGPNNANMPVDVMVYPHKIPEFEESMAALKIETEVFIDDVQIAIDEGQPMEGRMEGFDWSKYQKLDDINAWLDSLEEQFPGIVTSIVGGSSYEGRNIKGVKVSYKQGNPGVFIEAGIHAREWISPATVTYILDQLLTSKDTAVRDIAENYDWYIFPSVNPDGYVYTHTTNRMWRKTRSRTSESCFGVDANRNWVYHWNESSVSTNPCSDMYPGSKPFSEIETRSLSEYMSSIGGKLQVFLSFHSYSQFFLLPYGYSNNPVNNHDTLMDIGTKATNALSKRYGTKYTLGIWYDVMYPASGISMDWVRHALNVPITYTYELRDTGSYGFLLPPDQIIPTGKETLDSVVTILQEARSVLGVKS